MTERMVEVEWEDANSAHRWQNEDDDHHTVHVWSVGYLLRDDEEGIMLTYGFDGNTERQRNCTIAIPRSAIRNVWELQRAKK